MNRKELARQYKETPRPAGIYLVQHRPSGRWLLGASVDAPALLNRIRAQLRMKGHPIRSLQADWNADGAEAFRFEVVDLIAPSEDADTDLADDLATLESLWREKLDFPREQGYER